MKNVLKIVSALGLAAGILSLQGSAEALKNVPFGAINAWGPDVIDANPANPSTDYVAARASKTSFPAGAGHVDVFANAGAYQSAITIECSTGNSSTSRNGTNTTNGDISLACPAGGAINGGYGAIQY